MDARTCTRWSLCLLAASLAPGCAPLREFLAPTLPEPTLPTAPVSAGVPNKPNPAPPGDPTAPAPPADAIPGGTVVAAGGVPRPAPAPAAEQPLAPAPAPIPVPAVPIPIPLPQPRPAPQASNGPPPAAPPPAPLPPGYPVPVPFADPHLRANPTVTGARLQLAPWEVPADRVFELTKQVDLLVAQNTALLARIKELETLGAGREQALAEAQREIEALTEAAAKERAAIQAKLDELQTKLKQTEDEDVKFLEAVIEALRKLLPPEKMP